MASGFQSDSQGAYIEKDPDSTLDYTLDWDGRRSSWLGGDRLVGSTWILEAGIVLADHNRTETTTTAWISGGTDGTTYKVTNRVMTAGGRTDDRSFRIKCKNR